MGDFDWFDCDVFDRNGKCYIWIFVNFGFCSGNLRREYFLCNVIYWFISMDWCGLICVCWVVMNLMYGLYWCSKGIRVYVVEDYFLLCFVKCFRVCVNSFVFWNGWSNFFGSFFIFFKYWGVRRVGNLGKFVERGM